MPSFDKYLLPAKSYYEFVKEGVIICDTNCRIRYVNTAASELLQQSPRALIGKPLNSICDDTTVEKLKTRVFEMPKGLVIQFSKKQVPVYKTRVIATPLENDGKKIGVLLLLRNNELPYRVTQEQFLERNSTLRAIGLLEGQICTVSDLKTGGHVFVSTSVQRLVGWSVSNFLNGGWAFLATICHPDDLVEVQARLSELMAKYKDVNYNAPYDLRYRMRHKDGRWMDIEEKGSMLERDSDGSPRYILAFVKEAAGPLQPALNRFKLTQREMQVAECIVRGLSSKDIAKEFDLSVHTVNEVRKHLLRKTNSPNSAALVKALNDRG